MIKNIFKTIIKHKIISVIVLAGLVFLVFLKIGVFTQKAETRYVLSAVEKGSIVTSISGTGQIIPLDEISVKSKASGDITYLGVSTGEEVSAGKLLLKLDTSDAQDAIATAEDNLESAKSDLTKMQGITTDVGTLRGVKEKAEADLEKAYDDGFNNVSNVYLGLPTVISGLQTILLGYTFSSTQWNLDYYVNAVNDATGITLQYRNIAYEKYKTARSSYDASILNYKTMSRSSDEETIEATINDTYDTLKEISDSVKSAIDLIQYYQDAMTTKGYSAQSSSTTHLSSLNTYTSTVNGYLTNLLSTKTTIQSDKEALIETDYTLADQEKTVANLEKTLAESKEDLADYSTYAPSSGIISAVNVKKGDSVSSGSTIATLITKQKVAEITLNEVDVANVKIGQKTTLTFDAIEDLTITGQVTEVDTVGTTSQGVVSYTVQILLDTQNDKIKDGMSVSASIIVDSKQDILVISSSAIKASNGESYILIPAEGSYDTAKVGNSSGVVLKTVPTKQTITTGLTDNTSTEILTGLSEGDIIVSRIITSSATQTTTTSQTGANRNTGGFGGTGLPGL
ncbi:MAG: HlyD family efflux transporter periplasmic adaptor subunit [Elusimicrobiota bacterium]